jgi:hypothetical protein
MVVLLHGAVGGWDEAAIAVAAFVVLWVAVKLAGRKPARDDDDAEMDSETEATEPTAEDARDPAHSSPHAS